MIARCDVPKKRATTAATKTTRTRKTAIAKKTKQKGDVENALVTTEGPWKIDDERFHGQIINPDGKTYVVSQQNGLTHSGMWRATDFITGKVANTPLYVRKRLPDGGSEIDRKHDGHRLVRRKASATMLSLEWKRAATFHAFYTAGNSFSYIKSAPGRRFSELILLDPRNMVMYIMLDPVESNRGVLQSGTIIYEYHQNGRKYIMSQSDIFHIRGMTYNGLWGLPFFDYVKFAVGASNVARDFAFRFFEKGANPSFVVYYPRGLAPEKEEKWLESIKRAIEGIGNSHTTFPLYNDAKIEELTKDPDKTQGLEGRQFSLREIANFAGLPPSTVGVEDAQSYNSLEIATDAALDAIDPWFVRFEEEGNDKLLTQREKDTESHFYEFAREEVKRLDHRTKVTTAIQELNNGGMNQDEYRNIFKRPAGQSPNSSRFRMPANLVYMDGESVRGDLPITNLKNAVLDASEKAMKRITRKLVRLCANPERLREFVATSSESWLDVRPKMQAALELVPDGDETILKQWLDELFDEVNELLDNGQHDHARLKNVGERHLTLLEPRVCQYILSTGA